MDLSRIPTKNGAERGSRWTKIQQLYENVHLTLSLWWYYSCILSDVDCGKGLFLPFKNSSIFQWTREESGWRPKLRISFITYSYIKIDTNHNVDMFQAIVYRRKTIINLNFKNNSGTSTRQVQSCSSVSKNVSSQCRIPQLLENLQFNKTELWHGLAGKNNKHMSHDCM